MWYPTTSGTKGAGPAWCTQSGVCAHVWEGEVIVLFQNLRFFYLDLRVGTAPQNMGTAPRLWGALPL